MLFWDGLAPSGLQSNAVAQPSSEVGTGGPNYWGFSHGVTKVQTRQLLIHLRFYFHDVQEQLKTNTHTSFPLEWVLGFVLDYA